MAFSLPAVPRKGFGSPDGDTIYTIYLSLMYTQSADLNPLQGTACSIKSYLPCIHLSSKCFLLPKVWRKYKIKPSSSYMTCDFPGWYTGRIQYKSSFVVTGPFTYTSYYDFLNRFARSKNMYLEKIHPALIYFFTPFVIINMTIQYCLVLNGSCSNWGGREGMVQGNSRKGFNVVLTVFLQWER